MLVCAFNVLIYAENVDPSCRDYDKTHPYNKIGPQNSAVGAR